MNAEPEEAPKEEPEEDSQVRARREFAEEQEAAEFGKDYPLR